MKVAVMQPYIFPYIGYYQLVNAVNTFVFYDDVTYIKNGYINRNFILSNGVKNRFTISLNQASSNKLINDINCHNNVKKTIKTIQQSYSKAPNFSSVMSIVEKVLMSENRNVAHIASQSIVAVFEYLGIKREFVSSSELDYDRNLDAAEKLVSICELYESSHYINSIGGKELYTKEYFYNKGIKLEFIEKQKVSYQQNNNEFIDNLSMIDVLMWCSKEEVISLLKEYKIV